MSPFTLRVCFSIFFVICSYYKIATLNRTFFQSGGKARMLQLAIHCPICSPIQQDHQLDCFQHSRTKLDPTSVVDDYKSYLCMDTHTGWQLDDFDPTASFMLRLLRCRIFLLGLSIFWLVRIDFQQSDNPIHTSITDPTSESWTTNRTVNGQLKKKYWYIVTLQ